MIDAIDAAGVLRDDEGSASVGGVGEGGGGVGFGEDLEDVGLDGCASVARLDGGGRCGGEEGEGEDCGEE